MKKSQIFLIILVSIAIWSVVYSPHYRYPFPSHIDEWHHITEALEFQKGEYTGGVSGFRVAFQIILVLLSKVTDLVLIYKYLPASWAVFSALILFYVVYKKTGNQFYIALFAMIFFASTKSNVNITGLWFFTPLTFSIPFIYLYVYFFTKGVEKENKKFILTSLIIMILLLPLHSISVLFAIPFLAIYSLFNSGYFKKEWKFFTIFLSVPIIGSIFYKFMTKVPWSSLVVRLIHVLQFKRGWGVLEIENSFFELYSLIGYILAAIGIFLIFNSKENLKKYLAYVLWPAMVLISIMIYRKTDVSYLSPYQRNLYYFAISLPLLSALGLDYLFKFAESSIDKMRLLERKPPKGVPSDQRKSRAESRGEVEGREIFKKIGAAFFITVIIFFTFKSYWYIPKQIDLYEVVEQNEYEALLFLKKFPKARVMATPRISTGVYPITGHKPVATYFFYGNRKDAERFFQTKSCEKKREILDKYNVKYVLSKHRINCGWKLIYRNKVYIYDIGDVHPRREYENKYNTSVPE